jgi:glutamate-1-semialdehyde 2,1-aminomutase
MDVEKAESMAIVAIVQARTSSKRLPGKVLLPLGGKPMIIYQLERIAQSERIDSVILATSTEESDNDLARIATESGFRTFRGNLEDVLNRFNECAKHTGARTVVRLTGDCPLTDPALIDEIIDEFHAGKWQYLANGSDPSRLTVPDGFDIEVFSADALDRAEKEATLASEREHVTPWMKTGEANLKWSHFMHRPARRYYRLTVDNIEDYEVVSAVVNHAEVAGKRLNIDDAISYLEKNAEVAHKNLGAIRNEGYFRSLEDDQAPSTSMNQNTGQDLWNKAKRLIPGGNMLLSKRAEMFLPEKWPSYFSRAKGHEVWDLDGRKYRDMSIMGIGTNILGYGRAEVDNAVISAVGLGNLSTLNCKEEVQLAEKLIELHPWADMARFARSGGEANAIAIRIARAATGRDTIAICGYHGWHDWYLATNLQHKTGLSQHLLPGLEPAGVPKGLEGSVQPFGYNDFEQLLEISNKHNLAAVKMEVQRSAKPSKDFLQRVRDLCTTKGIVLIFDECSSGFRETYGGLHLKYNVNPDMAMFGKTLGNGYAITAIIGKRDVMQAAQKSFISSTFWTERIGPTAALAALGVMENEKSWQIATSLGQRMQDGWRILAERNGLEIRMMGIPALASFVVGSGNSLKYKTYITQEMLKKGYLAGTTFYASTSHTEGIIDSYLDELDLVFCQIGQCERGLIQIDELLDGPVCHDGFKRLN